MKEEKVIIGENGEIILPTKAMEVLDVKPGDKIAITIEGLNNDVIILAKAKENWNNARIYYSKIAKRSYRQNEN